MSFDRCGRVLRTAALVSLCALAAPAHAVLITGNLANASESPATGSNFSADLNYSFANATTGTLTVDITNTSPGVLGGFLTAFALNNPGGAITTSSLVGPASFTQLGLGGNTVDAQPFGNFDLGASATGGTFQGGGAPNGLLSGDSGHFVFSLTGTGLDTLTANSFVNELSVGPGDGKGDQFFVARFRGLDNTPDSDKVPGVVVPEPTTYALLLAGMGLLLFAMRRSTRPN